MLAVIALIILNTFLLPILFERFLAESNTVRIAIALAVLAPLNIAMGMPFPTGIRVLQQKSPSFLPWAFGVNGGASVIGSILCIIMALAIGFQAVAWIAAAIYLIGALIFTSRKSTLMNTA